MQKVVSITLSDEDWAELFGFGRPASFCAAEAAAALVALVEEREKEQAERARWGEQHAVLAAQARALNAARASLS